ncbi:MAG: RNA 2',3'-cyclic phosphodiesterase [Gammaproteobacteria bacterium]
MTRRLFFALWPDPMLRANIAHAARAAARAGGVEGRRMLDEKLHLTLAFLGDADAAAEARALAAAAALKAEAFELVLDQAGSFYRSKVFWIGASETPRALAALALGLRAALDLEGVAYDRKALAPHVTCYRDARPPIRPVPVEPLRWAVRGFALVHSSGGQYHVVSQWPLQTAPV